MGGRKKYKKKCIGLRVHTAEIRVRIFIRKKTDYMMDTWNALNVAGA